MAIIIAVIISLRIILLMILKRVIVIAILNGSKLVFFIGLEPQGVLLPRAGP